MRKLATIRKIVDLQPIPDADAIEVATVDNWKVVVKKGEFQLFDLVIYLEVDSWVPTELAPFLSKGQDPREYNGVKGERLRTVKLRGQISQGLILPLWGADMLIQKFATFSNVANRPYPVWIENLTDDGWYVMPDGRCVESALFEIDLTEPLGVQKYEPPVSAQLSGIVKGTFPSYIPKTDEERIQNLTKEYPVLQKLRYEVTEKVEGSSMTVGLIGDEDGNIEFIVCSRNLMLKETEDNTLWKLARKYDIERLLREIAPIGNIVVQGELVGEGIQGNHYGIKGHEFYVFRIYNINIGAFYPTDICRSICTAMKLKYTPVVSDNLSIADMTIDDILKMADGKSAINPTKLREGLVFKRADGEGAQEHFKAVSNQYLLKTGG